MADTFFVSVTLTEAADIVQSEVVRGSITGVLIDDYTVSNSDGCKVKVMVFEKHYYRAGNRLTLTVTLDNLSGKTRVHTASGGGGEGLFRFDWGAAESFAGIPKNALKQYLI